MVKELIQSGRQEKEENGLVACRHKPESVSNG